MKKPIITAILALAAALSLASAPAQAFDNPATCYNAGPGVITMYAVDGNVGTQVVGSGQSSTTIWVNAANPAYFYGSGGGTATVTCYATLNNPDTLIYYNVTGTTPSNVKVLNPVGKTLTVTGVNPFARIAVMN